MSFIIMHVPESIKKIYYFDLPWSKGAVFHNEGEVLFRHLALRFPHPFKRQLS